MRRTAIQIGFECASLDLVRVRLQGDVDLSFEERYSDYLGGDYYYAEKDGEEFTIQWNRDLDELAEPDFPQVDVILCIAETSRPEWFKVLLLGDRSHLIRETADDVPE